MPSKSVDFLLVGAHKCATTSLFKYLSAHPDIYVPHQKEISFFSSDHRFDRGLNNYLSEYFSEASDSQVRGEASVSYMRYEHVAERIASHLPGTKILAILRDPVARAFSHYRMAVREGHEARPFQECIENLLARGRVPDRDMQHTEGQSLEYVMSGEYGRLLKNYFKFFPADDIKVVFFEQLSRNPALVMQELFRWLGVSRDFQSTQFHKKFHVGGEPYIPFLDRGIVRASAWVRQYPKVWNILRQRLPRQRVLQFLFWLRSEANLKNPSSAERSEMPESTRTALIEHYESDVATLAEQIDGVPPWTWFQSRREFPERTVAATAAA